MSTDRAPNDPHHGTMHIWDVWNEVDYSVYRDYVPRFVSEFGFQGPPTWATLTRAIHDEPLNPDSPGMLLHQKAEDGNGKLARGLSGHLPAPTTMDDWHWATSLNQARAIRFGVEHFRSWSPRCMGAIVWQLNDCWPVTSWSAIDGDGRRKPLWYALRQSFADRLLTFQPRAAGLVLVAVNDSAERWTGVVEISRRTLDGSVLASMTATLDVDARCSTTVLLTMGVASAEDPGHEMLLAQAGAVRAFWFFCEDVAAALAPPDLDVALENIAGGYRLQVTSRSLVRDLSVLADKVAPDAVADDMLVTLLGGETATFEIRTDSPLTLAQLTSPAVLRSANQLVSPAGR